VKIGIIGPGALGCLFASRLFLTDGEQNTILLIDHNPDRAVLLNDQGILYESDTRQQRLSIPLSCTPAAIGHLDVLFFCVKSHDLPSCLAFASPLLSSSTLVVFLQNGISHLQYGQHNPPVGIPVFATSSEGATLLAPGHIKHAGKGQTYLGFLSPQHAENKKLQSLTAILNTSHIKSTVSSDILSRLWAKLFINVGINALTAIHNCTNGELLTVPEVKEQMIQLVKEAEQVAIASGIIIKEDPVAATLTVCQNTSKNISSMLQDVRKQRPTEIGAINGAISAIGQKIAIATPLNDELIAQVIHKEKSYNERTTS